MAFSEKLQSYNTFSAEVVTLEPAKQPATRQVVFIPGNPGLPAFYRAFFLHIQNYLGGHVLVSSISQLEHHSLASPSRRPTLDEQLKSKADFVKELKAAHKGLPITVIGHSLGGWMIVEILKHYPELDFQSILLFPSLSNMAHTPRGLQLGYILTPLSAHIVSYISKILQRLPSSLIRTVIRIATGQNEVCTTVSAQMAVNPALVWQVLGLGHEELQRVQQPDLLTLETFGRYIKCYWSRVHEDGWIAEDDIASIKAAIERGGGQAVRCIEGVKHDFCSSDEHSIYMAKICADWIEEDR